MEKVLATTIMAADESISNLGLPEDFLERLERQFPHDFQTIIETFHRRPPVIRINTLLTTSEHIRAELENKGITLKNTPGLSDSFRVFNADRKTITALLSYQTGQIYLQSIASQLVVKTLNPQRGEKILDLCAAPGSKTSQIAIMMKGKGELLANEPNRERFFRLIANLRLQRLDQLVTCKQHLGERYGDYYSEHFDKVLVDAPCSSETRFVTDDSKTTRYWSRHKVKAFSRLQRRLLDAAIECTKPGGSIVYSTCTFSPEENEQIIDRALRKHPEVSLHPIPWQGKTLPIHHEWNGKTLHESLQMARRIYPDGFQEGFFIALLLKRKPTL